MSDNRTPEQNSNNQRNQLPEEVLNAEVDRSSIKDPLQVQLDKGTTNRQSEESDLEQQRKEAMTERD